jgi:hypothetical protein
MQATSQVRGKNSLRKTYGYRYMYLLPSSSISELNKIKLSKRPILNPSDYAYICTCSPQVPTLLVNFFMVGHH